jgi:hypothetical protein
MIDPVRVDIRNIADTPSSSLTIPTWNANDTDCDPIQFTVKDLPFLKFSNVSN